MGRHLFYFGPSAHGFGHDMTVNVAFEEIMTGPANRSLSKSTARSSAYFKRKAVSRMSIWPSGSAWRPHPACGTSRLWKPTELSKDTCAPRSPCLRVRRPGFRPDQSGFAYGRGARTLPEALHGLNEVTECYALTGDFDFLRVVARDLDDLGEWSEAAAAPARRQGCAFHHSAGCGEKRAACSLSPI